MKNTQNPYGDGGASKKVKDIIKKVSLENILKASPDSLKSVFILELLTCKMKFMSIVTESKINKAEFQEFFDFLTSDTIWTKAFGEKFSKIKRDILKVKKKKDIPELNKYQCGTYKMHSLKIAKKVAKMVLKKGVSVMDNEELKLDESLIS